MEKWTLLESRYLLESPWGNVRRDRCLLPDGQVIDGYTVNEYPEWVNAAVFTVDGEMVLVRQYRHGCGEITLEVPGGAGEPGESAAEAIVREVREETGYASEQPPVLLGRLWTNTATNNNRISLYLIVDAERCGNPDPDATEDIEAVLIPRERVHCMIASGEITQCFAVLAYHLALAHMCT